MSAVNIVIDNDRAVVLTDGAAYEPDGNLVSLGRKCWLVEGRKAAVTGRGPSWFAPAFAKALPDHIASIDDMEAAGEAMIDRCIEAAHAGGLIDGDPAIDLFVIGWSDRDGRAKCAQFTTRAPVGVQRFAMVDSVLSPALSDEAQASVVAQVGRQERGAIDYDRFAIALMEEQRRLPGEIFAPGQFLVGGHILRTDVTARGVTMREIHHWPEDRVGERIRPTPRLDIAAHPNVSPMPANRAERRRLDRTKRRSAA